MNYTEASNFVIHIKKISFFSFFLILFISNGNVFLYKFTKFYFVTSVLDLKIINKN